MRRRFSALLRSRRGNMATFAAVTAPIFLAIAALAVDGSSLYLERRNLQAMADLAAISGASAMSDPAAAVLQQLRLNGVDPVLMTGAFDASVAKGATDDKTRVWVDKGTYTPDKSIAVDSRYVAGTANPNAVRVRLARPGHLYFGQSLIPRPAVAAAGTAAAQAEAAFAIGSRLASVNTQESALNGLLGGLLGTSLSLKLADYNALIATDVSALAFLDKLAPKVGLTAGTYQQLLASNVSVGALASALAEVAPGTSTGNTAKAALGVLGKNAAALAVKLPLGKLINLGSLGGASIGSGASGSYQNITANVMQMVSAAAMLGGTHQVGIGGGAPLIDLGVAKVTLQIAIGEPMQQTPFFRVGAVGSLVRTAQIRVLLQVDLLSSSGALGLLNSLANINLPIYIDIASAEGELKSVFCPTGPQSATVGVGVRTGIAGVYLGSLNGNPMTDFSKKPTVSKTRIADVLGLLGKPVASVIASATIPVGDNQQRLLQFSYSDIQNKTIKTVSSSGALTSLTGALLNNMSVELSVLGLGIPISGVTTLLGTLLTPVSPALDSLLFGVLDMLGVKLGQADVQVTGVLCQRAALTQ